MVAALEMKQGSIDMPDNIRKGYPTKRVPNHERLRKRGVAFANLLPRFRMTRGRIWQLHATKGWRLFA